MGWGLKESCDRLQLLAGDRLDIAYSLGMNDHPEFGGLGADFARCGARPVSDGCSRESVHCLASPFSL